LWRLGQLNLAGKKKNPISITIILNGKDKVKSFHATVVEENIPKRKF